MKKFIAALLIASITIPTVALGDQPGAPKPSSTSAPSASVPSPDPPPASPSASTFVDPAMIAPLQQGQAAPFPGILFSPRAAATVATEISTMKERIKIEVDAAVRYAEAQKDYKYNELNTSYVSDKSRYIATIDANEKRIKLLETDLSKTRSEMPNATLWFGVGTGVGVLATVLTVFAVSQASK